MAKKYVEGKFKKIKLLMSFLTILRNLDEVFNCESVFGFNACALRKNIYKQILDQVTNG